MGKRKTFRERGKLKLSNYFKRFNEGEDICVIREKSVKCAFPKRILGRSGKVIGKRGEYYIVRVNDLNKEKVFIIHPIHLKIIGQKKIVEEIKPKAIKKAKKESKK